MTKKLALHKKSKNVETKNQFYTAAANLYDLKHSHLVLLLGHIQFDSLYPENILDVKM